MKLAETSNKVAAYLQSHISGDVVAGNRIRHAYAQDGSILTMMPSLVVYPRTTNDIRKVARFGWQLAEKGHVLPVTPRGSGTDTSGAALGKGIILNTTAYMNRILELDTRQRLVRVQPGLNFWSLQQTLHTHGLFLPSYPANYKYSTVGGAIANNAAGEKSCKYGSMRDWVQKLEVVLANGEVIQTGKISKKELERKKGLATLEGELYRAVDGLVSEHRKAIDEYQTRSRELSRDNVGYALSEVFRKDGSCDLTPLFVGSQGTLGIISEAIIKLAPYSPRTSLLVAAFSSIEAMSKAVDTVMPFGPSSVEMIDRGLMDFIKKERGYNAFGNIFESTDGDAAAMLFVECDDDNTRKRNRKMKKMYKLLSKTAANIRATDDQDAQEILWAARDSSSAVLNYDHGGRTALPVIDDCIVPAGKLTELIGAINELSAKHKLDLSIWGHAGDANLHVMPLLDMRKLGDRQKIFRLMNDYFTAVVNLGGSIAAINNDGRLRAPFAHLQLGEELLEVNAALKKAVDPHSMLNPGVKTGAKLKDIVDLLADSYSLARHADYLPRL